MIKQKTERKVFMKTIKLILGIISFVLSAIVLFQSCVAGIGNTIENNGEAGGSAGVVLAVCCIVAGIVAIVTRNSSGAGSFVAGGFYLVGGIIGAVCAGSYGDLIIWGVLCMIFGAVFILGTVICRKKEQSVIKGGKE